MVMVNFDALLVITSLIYSRLNNIFEFIRVLFFKASRAQHLSIKLISILQLACPESVFIMNYIIIYKFLKVLYFILIKPKRRC